jgi:TonB family protein
MSQQQRGGLETEPSTIVPSGRKFLFGIGINAYQHLRPLRNAVKDLEDLTKVLLERYDFDESRLKLLKNEQATRNNIINTLYDLTNSDLLSADDSLLIYFSGHGVLDKNQEGYWVPVESERGDIGSFIPNLVVQSKIKNMKCRHVLLISDSCFSGSLLARSDSFVDDTIVADALESRKSRWIITSGGRDETVLDGSGSNSPFAEAILSELRHNHQPKLLTDKLALRIRDITRANAPQMSQAEKLYEAGDLGGRFVFNLRDREADDWQATLSENSVLSFEAFKNRYPGSSHRAEAQKYIDALSEQAAWEVACKANRLWTYNDFINSYPQSTFVRQALQKIAELEDQEDWNRAKVTQTLSAYWEYKTKHPTGRFLKEANTEIDELRKQNEAKQAALEQEFNRVQAEKQRSDAAKKQEEKDERQEERRLAKIRQEEAIEKKKNEQKQAEAQISKQPIQKPQVYQPMPSKPHDDVDNEAEQEDAMSSDGLWGRYKNSMGVVIGAALLFLAIYAIVMRQPSSKSSIEAAKDTMVYDLNARDTVQVDFETARDTTQVANEDALAAVRKANEARIKKILQSGFEELNSPPKPQPDPVGPTSKEEEIFSVVDEPPSFPVGMTALNSFLGTNIRYPSAAQRANVSGKVFVSFVVNTDGSIQDVVVFKGLGFGTDEEAVRVVKLMPKWKPGKQSGRPVRVKYNLPINFQLE